MGPFANGPGNIKTGRTPSYINMKSGRQHGYVQERIAIEPVMSRCDRALFAGWPPLSHESVLAHHNTKCHMNCNDSASCMRLTNPRIVIHYSSVTTRYVLNDEQQITAAKGEDVTRIFDQFLILNYGSAPGHPIDTYIYTRKNLQ